MDVVKLIYHLIAFTVSLFATAYDYFEIKIGHSRMGGKFKYLTFWNMCFQTLYFGHNLISDLTEKRSNPANPSLRGTLQRWRDVFHACIVFPTTMFVCVTFWVLYAVDRELIFPKSLDNVFPMWLNHLVHTTILPFILIDKLVTHHHYPRRSSGMMGVVFLAMLYLAWVFLIAYLDDFWVYPILQVLGVLQRTVFLSICIAFFISFYILGESITTLIWGKGPSSVTASSHGKKKSARKAK